MTSCSCRSVQTDKSPSSVGCCNMEQFLLNNIDLYQNLVKSVKPARVPPQIGQTNPDIVVSARIRPLVDEDAAFPCAIFPRSPETGIVDVHELYNHPRGRPILKSFNYHVDRLFGPQATTEEVYESLVADLIPYACDGGIGTVFAYGQTGSGKTFTVGNLEIKITRALMNKGSEDQKRVYITIIELAGNSAYDLLSERAPIMILEDAFGNTQLAGAKEHLVQTQTHMTGLILDAACLRSTASTLKNDASSRSHAICRIRIHDPSSDSDGFLYLVDLAGSEAARDRAVHGADRMRETKEINISLSVLKDCIRGKAQAASSARSKQKKPHIPFRSSALTKVLKHVFDPAGTRPCRTVVIACVNPSLADTGPSKNTLRYAEMLRVRVPAASKPVSQATGPMAWTNAQLQEWIRKNSGTPTISPTKLAPTESGAQLLRLSAKEFEERCQWTPNVSLEQAKAFRSKLWQLHVDSISSSGDITRNSSSRNPDPEATSISFKKRIRPGMVVSCSQTATTGIASGIQEGLNLVLVLSPATAFPGVSSGVITNTNIANDGLQSDGLEHRGLTNARYLCALVVPSQMAGAYELNIWSQLVVDVEQMESEVILEYDASTRYYYVTV
ncbi:P-loop containing nucleoside triphosphate hydrolase protein [Xylariaceae sp. FL1019]|nr:P-loop containing nucleoside triphosphate hydrolase protein [Xylariaceae sp. FL1019]